MTGDMTTLQTIIDDAVAAQAAPFVVAMVANGDGVLWSGEAGDRAPGVAATNDTVFRIFSMTKAIGALSAMILIDRGKLDADAPVDGILPDFAKLQVLDGFDGDAPRLRAPRSKATVRQLATHTSGLVYEFWNADLPRYFEATGAATILSGQKAGLNYPLAFDPGDRWDYGIGIDWLGQVVEAVDGRRIDQFCKEEIFAPLGMRETRFEPEPDIAARLAAAAIRGEDGKLAPFDIAPPSQPEFYGMGHTLYATAPDYLRFLRCMLNKGSLDGARILSEAGYEAFTANSIGDLRVGKMTSVAPPLTADVDLFPGTPKTHSIGFLRVEEDVPGMRSAGSQGWAGVCNTHYWFDPAKNVAAVLMTQTLPFVEPPFLNLYERFERGVYAAL